MRDSMKVNVHPILTMLQPFLTASVAVLVLVAFASLRDVPFEAEYVMFAAIVLLAVPYCLGHIDLLSDGETYFLGRILMSVLLRWLGVLILLTTIVYVAGGRQHFDLLLLSAWACVTPITIIATQSLVDAINKHFFTSKEKADKAIIVGVSPLSIKLANSLQRPNSGIQSLGFFEDRDQVRLPEKFELLGGFKDVHRFVAENQIQIVYITVSITQQSRIHFLLDELRDTTVSIYYLPDVFVSDMIQSRFFTAAGIPMVSLCESPFIGVNGIIKRLSDIVISAVILLLISPILLLIAIGVKFTSPGPILFKQARYGLGGEKIMVYKFRSMTVCENGQDVVQAKRNDSRITPFGAFLRRQSLDELPQFINVLQGSMSVVGPRPHAVAHNEFYRKQIKGYMIRHKVKPGITGWAQVNGSRGETETVEKMQARIEFDLDYLRRWSLSLDIWIILRTVGVVIKDNNAY